MLAGVMFMFPACSDDYEWAQETPSWLGESIYGELSRRGNFSIYLKMVDDLGQTDFLSKTGSLTVFVADDDTYRAYFKAHGMDENNLTPSMKKYLVNSTMLENAYVLDLLTNESTGSGIVKGQVMRRVNTEWTQYDSIPAVTAADLPEASVSADWWSYLRDKNQPMYNLVDDGTVPMVHFIWRHMMTQGMTKSDFSYLFNGTEFQEDDVYINNVRVREGNVTCQNGYIHIMDGVPAPLPNMAEYLRTNGSTNLFSKLVDRFSAPFSATSLSKNYIYLRDYYAGQNLYPALTGGDSIYVRRYFYSSADGTSMTTSNDGTEVSTDACLKFDPSMHNYAESENLQGDMGAIFAPTDEALISYWNSEDGSFLRERYPSEEPFEQVPNNVLAEFLNNHMQYSFMSSLPSRFDLVLDDAKEPIGLEEADIIGSSTSVCDNGAVYVMRNVYAPASFRSVIAPTLVNENMRVMSWAIDNLDFKPYLLSMVSHYDFLILTDNALSRYVDPVSYSTNNPRWFRFYYDETTQTVQAYSYRYDKTVGGWDGCVEEDLQLLNSTYDTETKTYVVNPVVEDRLEDLLNTCIIPRDINGQNYVGNGSEYYLNKDDGILRVVQLGNEVSVEDQFGDRYVKAQDVVEMDNGVYYVMDQMVEPTFRSLMDELNAHEEYSEFRELLLGNQEGWTPNEESVYALIRQSGSYYSMNEDNTTVRSFNSFHYTVYVPDNEAMAKAYAWGLPSWDDINDLDNVYAGTDVNVDSIKTAWTQRVVNFLKYHFQDNSIYIGGDPRTGSYETAALELDGIREGMSYTLQVSSSPAGIVLNDNSDKTPTINILPNDDQFYNRKIREYSFSTADNNAAALSAAGLIATTSYAVVHRISEPLIYDDECFCMDRSSEGTGN